MRLIEAVSEEIPTPPTKNPSYAFALLPLPQTTLSPGTGWKQQKPTIGKATKIVVFLEVGAVVPFCFVHTSYQHLYNALHTSVLLLFSKEHRGFVPQYPPSPPNSSFLTTAMLPYQPSTLIVSVFRFPFSCTPPLAVFAFSWQKMADRLFASF
jgi:hypothetical protein